MIIAGPNGAGKTTFAREYLPHEAGCPVFVNAGLIAAGLGKANFAQIYRNSVDTWTLYDNSGDQPILIDWSARHDDSIN